MKPSVLGLVELLLVFGVVMGLGVREIWSLRREKQTLATPPPASEEPPPIATESNERAQKPAVRPEEGDPR